MHNDLSLIPAFKWLYSSPFDCNRHFSSWVNVCHWSFWKFCSESTICLLCCHALISMWGKPGGHSWSFLSGTLFVTFWLAEDAGWLAAKSPLFFNPDWLQPRAGGAEGQAGRLESHSQASATSRIHVWRYNILHMSLYKTQTAVAWSCLLFSWSGQNHLVRLSERMGRRWGRQKTALFFSSSFFFF